MDVAVVIPLFNGAKWIRRTLESVFTQSQRPVEVVIVDDGSEDKSLEIVREFSGVTLLRHPGKGTNSARNFGLKQTTAPLVAFLDQDDVWHPEHLRLLSSILEQHPKCPAAIASCCFFKLDDSLVFLHPEVDVVPYDPWSIFPIHQIATPSAVIIRRTALNAAGDWPTQSQFIGTADVYTWLRLSVADPLIKNRSITLGYRCHSDSHSGTLRAKNAQIYVDAHVAASEEAVSYRLAAHPQDASLLRRQLEILTAMSGILKVILDSDGTRLTDAALAFENSMCGDSPAFIQSMCNQLFWYLHPTLQQETPKRRNAILGRLLEQWPIEARNTRKAVKLKLKQVVPIWNLLSYLGDRPSQLHRWFLFADIVWTRSVSKLKWFYLKTKGHSKVSVLC